MKLLVLCVFCIGMSRADSQVEASEVSSSTKLSSSKSNLNSISGSSAQKPSHTHQSQPQYVQQYVVQKPVLQPQHHHQQQQQPAAMYIIAQPSQSGSQSPLFQQAVQQLLSYYNNNPQARYQLLQQQGGIPQGVYHQPQSQHNMPSGALHVIPSPQLESSLGGHLPQQFSGGQSHYASSPQAIFAVPANSQLQLSPSVLAQIAQAIPSAQHQQYTPQQFQTQQYQPQAAQQQYIPQHIPVQLGHQHFGSQFAQQAQYTLPPQFHYQQSQSGIPQGQFGGKAQLVQSSSASSGQLNTNEFSSSPSDKNQAASSNYSPVYRTAYIKG